MHRDIKGANILVDNAGRVKLADFGASKQIEELATLGSGFKSVRGTPYWMAPEIIREEGHGREADIWSVACTVIEMATGRPPWSGVGNQVQAMFQIASSKGPPPIPEHLSADCKDFLYLCFNRCGLGGAGGLEMRRCACLGAWGRGSAVGWVVWGWGSAAVGMGPWECGRRRGAAPVHGLCEGASHAPTHMHKPPPPPAPCHPR